MNSSDYDHTTNTYNTYIEPLHISTKYLDYQNKQKLIDMGIAVKNHHSRIVRPAF
jgi:hypothetical protein